MQISACLRKVANKHKEFKLLAVKLQWTVWKEKKILTGKLCGYLRIWLKRKQEARFQRKFNWIFLTGQCGLMKNLGNNECAVLIWSTFITEVPGIPLYISTCDNVVLYFLPGTRLLDFPTLDGEVVWQLESIIKWPLFLCYRAFHLPILAMTWSWKWKQQVIQYNTQGHEILATSLGPFLCTLMIA